MKRILSLLPMLVLLSASPAQASVFGEHVRGDSASDKYPEKLVVGRFSEAVIGDMTCEWENAGSFALKTDRGNIDISSYTIAPSAIKVSCEGKQPFYAFDVPAKLLDGGASEDAVGLWFGKVKDREGCEGYIGCDKVHVLHTYHSAEKIVEQAPEEELQAW